jgi:ubiquinone biosynthesis protein COQ4
MIRPAITRVGRKLFQSRTILQHPFTTTTPESNRDTSPSPSVQPSSVSHSHHVPTTGIQRGLLTAVSAVTALVDPKRADMVAALGETTGLKALSSLRKRMRNHPVGSIILNERPQLTEDTLNLDKLRQLPKGTFGEAYVTWMDKYGYSPNERPEVRYIENDELAYIMQRYRQTHDFCHVLLNLPPTVLGEVVIKWFELAQTQLPMTFLSAMFGPFSVGPREWRVLMQSGAFSWASKI